MRYMFCANMINVNEWGFIDNLNRTIISMFLHAQFASGRHRITPEILIKMIGGFLHFEV